MRWTIVMAVAAVALGASAATEPGPSVPAGGGVASPSTRPVEDTSMLIYAGKVEAGKPIVVYVHGLDSCREHLEPLGSRTAELGYNVAYFCYDPRQSVSVSAGQLAGRLAEVRKANPKTKVSLVTHSLGGLLARAYIEGEGYAGEVERLIMLAPPNQGARWAKYHVLVRAARQLGGEPLRVLSEGNEPAVVEMEPGSEFLRGLNSRQRRDGVRYTIIAGGQNSAVRMGAELVDQAAGAAANAIGGRWGGVLRAASAAATGRLRGVQTSSDGPIKVEATRLAGVEDFVVVTADHQGMIGLKGEEPPAWAVVRERLRR